MSADGTERVLSSENAHQCRQKMQVRVCKSAVGLRCNNGPIRTNLLEDRKMTMIVRK
jgi:hypothetical protein